MRRLFESGSIIDFFVYYTNFYLWARMNSIPVSNCNTMITGNTVTTGNKVIVTAYDCETTRALRNHICDLIFRCINRFIYCISNRGIELCDDINLHHSGDDFLIRSSRFAADVKIFVEISKSFVAYRIRDVKIWKIYTNGSHSLQQRIIYKNSTSMHYRSNPDIVMSTNVNIMTGFVDELEKIYAEPEFKRM